jgi:hypothetical protein
VVKLKTEYLKFEQEQKRVSRNDWMQLAVVAAIVAGLWVLALIGG